MKTYLKAIWLCLFLLSSKGLPRMKRSDGRVELISHIRPPATLKKGEAPMSPPGWKHCVKSLSAKRRWRILNNADFSKYSASQFQCTWVIQADIPGARVEISVQKLELGNKEDKECRQQFIEIVDQRKSQGRFCDKQKPGDYVSSLSTLRLDIQGENTLAELARSKKSPFVIIYKTVTDKKPGFRPITQKPKQSDFDPFHTATVNSRNSIRSTSKRQPVNTIGGRPNLDNKWPSREDWYDNNSKTQAAMYGLLNLSELIAVVVCCTVAIIILSAFLIKRFCCSAGKHKPEQGSLNEKGLQSSSLSNIYPPPAYINSEYLLPDDEMIITSEVLRNTNKVSKSISDSSKKGAEDPAGLRIPTKRTQVKTSSEENKSKDQTAETNLTRAKQRSDQPHKKRKRDAHKRSSGSQDKNSKTRSKTVERTLRAKKNSQHHKAHRPERKKEDSKSRSRKEKSNDENKTKKQSTSRRTKRKDVASSNTKPLKQRKSKYGRSKVSKPRKADLSSQIRHRPKCR